MTDEQLAAMHRLLAEYHRKVVTESLLDVVQQYHADLAQRLADEAALIPRRTAIVERLHEREHLLIPCQLPAAPSFRARRLDQLPLDASIRFHLDSA